jgi:hypothetical protein
MEYEIIRNLMHFPVCSRPPSQPPVPRSFPVRIIVFPIDSHKIQFLAGDLRIENKDVSGYESTPIVMLIENPVQIHMERSVMLIAFCCHNWGSAPGRSAEFI